MKGATTMTHFEKTALYDRMADFISIMDEDELRELAQVCKVKADLLQQERRERQRVELMKKLQNVLTAIQQAGFDVNTWQIKLNSDEIYSIKLEYVGV